MKKVHKRFFSLLLAAVIAMGGFGLNPISAEAVNPGIMEVHFLDVGQGDATLITCGNHAMLIDTGDDTKGTAIQNYLQKRKIKKLDYLILTHPDADHIGGAPVIITKFDIDKVFVSNFEKDTKTYEKLIQSLDHKRLKARTPLVGSKYYLGMASFTILAPGDEYDNPNDASVSLLVKNGNNKFLFTGDAGEAAEEDMLDADLDLAADVYHVGHHGSRYSTSKEFLKAVKPSYAVISCGEDNSYGHRHAETLNAFRTGGIEVYRTDEAGTVVASSDGKKITFNVPASDTWKAGEPTGSPTTSPDDSSAAAQKPQQETSASQPAVEEPQQKTSVSQPVVEEPQQEAAASQPAGITYVLNKNTKKFHLPQCSSVDTIKPKNREDTTLSRDSVTGAGYVPCKRCNP